MASEGKRTNSPADCLSVENLKVIYENRCNMQGYNCIMVYSHDTKRILMCRRKKDPYKGLSNLVGGKIEPGEDGCDAAYRELFEETGISGDDIELKHLMDFTYYFQKCYVEIYVGRLAPGVVPKGDENELYWSDFDHDFFDMALYAGEGNIGHMIEQVRLYWDDIFDLESTDSPVLN